MLNFRSTLVASHPNRRKHLFGFRSSKRCSYSVAKVSIYFETSKFFINYFYIEYQIITNINLQSCRK